MKYDTIIFDIDGTLWDATAASAKGWNLGLEKMGIDKKVSAEEVASVAGKPYEECVEMLLPGLQEEYPDLLNIFDEYEIEILKTEGGTFYEGVIEGIKILAKSHKIFLVSNCQDWYMKLFLKLSGLEEVLSGFDCYGMSGVGKDEMLRKIKGKNSVYVGDTQGDRVAAELAGVDFIYAAYGFSEISEEAKSFDSFPALLNYLKSTL